MIGALVLLILVICTNYSMVCFICHGLHVYGAWLNKYHRRDLWLLRVLVSMKNNRYLTIKMLHALSLNIFPELYRTHSHLEERKLKKPPKPCLLVNLGHAMQAV